MGNKTIVEKYGLLEISCDTVRMIRFQTNDIGVLYEFSNEREKTKILPRLREIKRFYPAL